MPFKSSDRVGYGVTPPPMSFSYAISILEDIYRKTGGGLSTEDLAGILGSTIKSSAFSRMIQFLKKLGLITYQAGQAEITPLAKKIVSPSSSVDRPEGLMTSMLKIEILSNVFEKYKGGMIPKLDYLANYLVGNTEVPNNLKVKWAEYFMDAATTANLLQDRPGGTIYLRIEPIIPNSEKAPDDVHADTQKITDAPSTPIPNLEQFFSGMAGGSMKSYLLSNNRKAYFYVPDGLSSTDVNRLRAAIKSLEIELEALRIEDDYKNNEQTTVDNNGET